MVNRIFAKTVILALVAVSGCQTQQASNPIAFSRLTGDYWQIWTMQPDGSNMKQVTTSSSDKRYPVWPNNDGELLFRTNNNYVFKVNIDTGEESRILETLGLVGGAVPSPTGPELLLVRYRSQLKDSANLWVSKSIGENPKILTREAGLQYDPDWSPDGSRIAYICGHGYRTDELYVVDSDGKNKRRLTKNEAIEVLPAWSPDGRTIVYVSDVTGDYEISLMDANGGHRKRLTDTVGIDTRPCWSPNGKKIMFVSNRQGPLQLWVMNNDGSNSRKLTTGAPSMDPAWRRK